MSTLRELHQSEKIRGLNLKRKLGEMLIIEHIASGETLLVQVTAFHSGFQVSIAFRDDERNFQISREEVVNGKVD